MTDFDRFDILTALFPFLDLPHRKPRPVLVLSDAGFNIAHGHLIAAMITTGADSHWPSDFLIADLHAAGLRHRSVVRWKVFTLSLSEIGRRIGRLSRSDAALFAVEQQRILMRADAPRPGEPV